MGESTNNPTRHGRVPRPDDTREGHEPTITVHRYGDAGSRRRFGGRTSDALRSSRPVMAKLLATKEFDLALAHHHFPYYAYLGVARRKSIPEVMTFHASYWQELHLEGADRSIGKPLESLFFGGFAMRVDPA